MSRRMAARYDALTITLHWLIAVLILGLVTLGVVIVRLPLAPAVQFTLFQWHKSFGMLALLLAGLRLLHSLMLVRVAPAIGLSRLEHRAARTVHHLLLMLAFFVPLAGWLIASVSPLEIPTFAFNLFVIPHLPLSKSDTAEALWTTVHATLAYLTLALVAIHSGAALHHHYRRHDDVLLRILPLRLRRSRPSSMEGGS